jgi:hypothetical protein
METKPFHRGNMENYGLGISCAEDLPRRVVRGITAQKTARFGHLAGNQYSSAVDVARVGL